MLHCVYGIYGSFLVSLISRKCVVLLLSGPFLKVWKSGLKSWTDRIRSLNHSWPIPGSGRVCRGSCGRRSSASWRSSDLGAGDEQTTTTKKDTSSINCSRQRERAEWDWYFSFDSKRKTMTWWLAVSESSVQEDTAALSKCLSAEGHRTCLSELQSAPQKGTLSGQVIAAEGQIAVTRQSRSNQAPLKATDKQIIDDAVVGRLLQLLPSLLLKLAESLLWPSLCKHWNPWKSFLHQAFHTPGKVWK